MVLAERPTNLLERKQPVNLTGYSLYQNLGGIINIEDYRKALERAKETTSLERTLVGQAESMARHVGIQLGNSGGHLDNITTLYGVLRTDTQPEGQEYHHSQMSDQRIFVEALRMLNRLDLLGKMISAYPNIKFF